MLVRDSHRCWPVACGCYLAVVAALLTGCGQTRSTDTSRSATEQLLISDAVDRAVSDINFRVLAGRKVYFDPQYLKAANADDTQYLTSTLRQHLLASGCVLAEKKEDAEFVVEARSGAVGTDRHDLLYGVPATNLGSLAPVPGLPAAIPEIPLAKRTSQRGVAKLAVFAYERATGDPVWQSGVSQFASNSRNIWVLGVGPFQSGTIYRGTNFAGREIPNPLAAKSGHGDHPVWVSKEARFIDDPIERLAFDDRRSNDRGSDDRGSDDRGFDDRGFDDRGFDSRGNAGPGMTYLPPVWANSEESATNPALPAAAAYDKTPPPPTDPASAQAAPPPNAAPPNAAPPNAVSPNVAPQPPAGGDGAKPQAKIVGAEQAAPPARGNGG